MKINQLVIIGVLAAVSGLSGCALAPSTVNLNYKPMDGVAKIENAEKIPVSVQVNDLRADKTLGKKKNGYWLDGGAVNTSTDVASTIKDAITTELQSRSFVTTKNGVNSVNVNITELHNKFKEGFWAIDAFSTLKMNVTVKSASNEVMYNKSINVDGHQSSQLATASNAKLSVDNAIANAMADLFNDKDFIAALLSGASKPASN